MLKQESMGCREQVEEEEEKGRLRRPQEEWTLCSCEEPYSGTPCPKHAGAAGLSRATRPQRNVPCEQGAERKTCIMAYV